MSDPQINIEIEDVLASIRRLVSEGEAPRRSAVVAAPEAPVVEDQAAPAEPHDAAEPEVANSPVAPDKLILSPEQMVSVPVADIPDAAAEAAPLLLMPQAVEPDAGDEAAAEDAGEAPQPETEGLILGAGQTEEVIEAEQGAASDETVQAPDASTDVAPQEEGTLSAALEPSDEGDLAASGGELRDQAQLDGQPEVVSLSDVEAMWHSVRTAPSVTGPDAAVGSGRGDLLSTIAELEAAVSDATDEFEPDGSEKTPVVDWAETTANGAIFGARASTTRIADVADLGEELRKVDPEVSPQSAGQTEEIVAEAIIDTESEELASRLDEELAQYLEAGTAIDEDALRELVREIIRQELQGALGERITRNVRKLVRREIYRVMASEEFS